ncbi:hypothetical protein MPTK1_1g14240 [Marchantia polymorpha subsp. ruderalis]|uniref:Uncharacterized protein n=2 Tax=Marchantia polymorpha TaxID=3197 RepID=A0AAF6AQ13_MARPO|nr:hypothetical protein MARPO_0179s0005 [Marchantia polymorpha]BBM98533.1 hypothetical protein Mp_1g14240 [Marchantia polymorpha subsp. ruderalis]|eukprot:PTQ27914.1 hypothetical protein MARPO_0179s0005 [Marchantia polymorpha]
MLRLLCLVGSQMIAPPRRQSRPVQSLPCQHAVAANSQLLVNTYRRDDKPQATQALHKRQMVKNVHLAYVPHLIIFVAIVEMGAVDLSWGSQSSIMFHSEDRGRGR